MKKKIENKLDEMQEQRMLKVEHNGCWLAFWGLFATLMIQVLIYGAGSWRYTVGEWIVFMCLALYIAVDCIRNGVWDRRLSPTPIVNVYASVVAGIIAGILNSTLSYRRSYVPSGAVVAGIISGIIVFALCFAALSCSMLIYKKRVKHLEQEDADEDK